MNLLVKKTIKLQGEVITPGSKSQSVRAILLAALSQGRSSISNLLYAEDTEAVLKICKDLNIDIQAVGSELIIQSTGLPFDPQTTTLYSKNSGITTRFILPLFGLRKNNQHPIILNCGEQMRARPIHSLVTALTDLGLTIQYLEKPYALPVAVSGELIGGETEVSGITSQFLSALLLALPLAKKDSVVKVQDLCERPYVELTLNWLREQKINFTHQSIASVDIYKIKGQQKYQPINTTIAGDFSSASYLIASAALIPGEVCIQGLDLSDSQGDKRLIPILQEMGAEIEIYKESVVVRGGKPLSGIKIDANDIPDLLPTLAVLGTYATGKTEINNVPQARIKETDRIHSMAEGLSRLNAKVIPHAAGLTIHQSHLKGNYVKGYGDHRTVMALSLAGLMAEGITTITDSEAIHKTFPTFITLMQSLGANMEVEYAEAS